MSPTFVLYFLFSIYSYKFISIYFLSIFWIFSIYVHLLNSTYIIIYLSIYIVYLSIFVLLRPFNQFNLLWEFRSLFMTVFYLSIYLSIYLQGDQLYIAVLFWYLGKRDLFYLCYCTLLHVANTSVTFNKVPEQHGHV